MRPSTIIIALLVSIVTLAASLAYGYGDCGSSYGSYGGYGNSYGYSSGYGNCGGYGGYGNTYGYGGGYGYGYRSPYLINLVYPQPIYQPNYIPSYTYWPGYYNRPFYSGYYW